MPKDGGDKSEAGSAKRAASDKSGSVRKRNVSGEGDANGSRRSSKAAEAAKQPQPKTKQEIENEYNDEVEKILEFYVQKCKLCMVFSIVIMAI